MCYSQLLEDGYLVLEDFLAESECTVLLRAGIDLTKRLSHKEEGSIFSTSGYHGKQQLNEDYFLESNDKISYFFEKDAFGENEKLKVNQSISLNKVGHALHLLHPMFKCFTFSDRVKKVCEKLGFCDPAVVQSMYIYKNPGIGSEVIPHQDATYLYSEPTPPVGFWIALEDATIENGCLWIIPGSHKSGAHRRFIRNPDKKVKEALLYNKCAAIYPESRFRATPVKKGTCILLHGLVVHKSAHNRSTKSRHAYTFHVVEKFNNSYSPHNWLQEGTKAPFLNLYQMSQITNEQMQ